MGATAWQITPEPCRCGCGRIPKEGKFLRGHFSRIGRHVRPDSRFLDTFPEIPIPTTKNSPESPARNLLRACFEEAWQHRLDCERRQLDLFCAECRENRLWALATAALYPLYSFIGMCEVLGLDARQTRRVFLATAN